jgi:hypothetical protein
MSRSKTFITCTVLSFSILSAVRIQAGQATTFGWHSGVASLAATTISPAPTPNDNVVGASPYKIFVTQKNYVGIGTVDITFDVVDNGGTTEYDFVEGVQNSTGLPWNAYHLELGYGFDAGFVKSLSGDGLDFDWPDADSPVQFDPAPGFYFPAVTHAEDDLFASGGVMPNGAFAMYFRFSIDVPDGITQFTLRQSPVVAPEPSSLVFVAIGLCGLITWRRTARR